MAMLIHEFKKYKVNNFRDYINEIVSPIEHLYGTNDNFDNEKIINDINGVHTFFLHDDIYYVVYINKDGYFGFGSSAEYSANISNYSDSNSFTKSTKQKNNGFKIFNFTFYVILKLIQKQKLKEYWFEGSNLKLKKVYKKMVSNKKFQKNLNDIGYTIEEFKDSYFIKGK